MLEQIRCGGKRDIAAALANLETRPDDLATAQFLDAAFAAPLGFSLGLTGPPGVGKSTLIDAVIRAWRQTGKTIAIIAVDPSSARSGGALLGDRTRLTTDPGDNGVFIRSMAARDRLGGIAEETYPAMVMMRALFDLVIVETVGAGQSETAIADIADVTAFCAQPGSGDALQYMKAGIMEVPDMVIVTKADMGQIARRTHADLKGALSLGTGQTDIPVISCAATTGEGIDTLLETLSDVAARISPNFAHIRAMQLKRWSENQIRVRFGAMGLEIATNQLVDNSSRGPFCRVLDLKTRLSDAITAAFE
ncbi:MAG: GTP-binding protein [Pseudomonadota bacterium]